VFAELPEEEVRRARAALGVGLEDDVPESALNRDGPVPEAAELVVELHQEGVFSNLAGRAWFGGFLGGVFPAAGERKARMREIERLDDEGQKWVIDHETPSAAPTQSRPSIS
jgi:hypothetical protein